MAQTQKYSAESVENLATAFPRRNENSFAWGNVISYYLGLPQLRGFWPMSSVNENGNVLDFSGQVRTLTNNGTTPFAVYSLQSYANLDGATQYFSRADEAGLKITGAITFGGWFRSGGIASSYGLMAKYLSAGNQRSYLLRQQINTIVTYISANGVAVTTSASTNTISANQWFFAAGRFVPSVSVDVIVNDTVTQNLVAPPASIFSSTANFYIGAWDAGATERYLGDTCLNFLCAAACSDAQINALYWLTRPLFFGS